jgi:uncharacterized protein (TIGR03118 family)
MNKHKSYAPLALAALIGFSSLHTAQAQTGRYVETDLVVNKQSGTTPTLVDSNGITHVAKFFDANLRNPWGLTESATSAFWIADGGAGLATLYNTAGAPQPLIVSIPNAANPFGTDGIPTGAVFNSVPVPKGAFMLSGVNGDGLPTTASAVFIFATKDGNILGWNPGVNPVGFDKARAGKYAVLAVNKSATAAYTGLALATDADGTTRLYAANFRAGTIDVFDTNFKQVDASYAFADPYLPRGYAPFNVAIVDVNRETRLFVTYALQDLTKLAGQGRGIVNSFDLEGSTQRRFAQHGQLNAPWGIVVTPAGFGELGGALWIGNFGDGRINAYDPTTGAFMNKVRTPDGKAVVIDGLWSLRFGNGGNGGSADTLYFTAGPNGETDGLFGSLDPQ